MADRHHYNEQLNARDKLEMQNQIARQRDEIDELRAELREIRQMARNGGVGGLGLGAVAPSQQSDSGYQGGGVQQGGENSYPHANGVGSLRRESVLRDQQGGGGMGLPPLRSVTSEVGIGMRSGGFMSSGAGGNDAMSGVQYQNERVGGFGGFGAR